MELIKLIDRIGLLNLLEGCDNESKDTIIEDYISNWDQKHLWNTSPPSAYIIDDKLAGIIFYNYVTVNETTNEISLYIQRTFTVPAFRKQGIFTKMLESLWLTSFELNCKSMFMFCNKENFIAWEKKGFVKFGQTPDDKYWVVLAPFLANSMAVNNTCFIALCNSNYQLKPFTSSFLEFIHNKIKSQ